jgi:lantibiotic leader peptide-processing serine protease
MNLSEQEEAMSGWKVFLWFAALVSFMASGLAHAADNAQRQIIIAKSESDYDLLKNQFVAEGGTVVTEMKKVLSFVGIAPMEIHQKSATFVEAKSKGRYRVGSDQIRHIVRPSQKEDLFGTPGGAAMAPLASGRVAVPALLRAAFKPDPALSLPGLMWDYSRIHAKDAWSLTRGKAKVLVGVADTGLDYTHSELANKVTDVIDLTDPTLCKTYVEPYKTDADWAAEFGGPVDTDWNGHGTWIGGNIAAVVDGYGINGIAPNVGLVSLKISEWCGFCWDSSIIYAFLRAVDLGVEVVSISFGGYTNRDDPAQDATYQLYETVVHYAQSMGTVIVASAGNEHARIDVTGKVVSHGTLTEPGTPLYNYYGWYDTPAGVPGVVMVSSTGNKVEAPSDSCAPGTFEDENATCKPKSDHHQSFGIGKKDQLAYYSNYGPRIDIAAPGGAREFNLPYWDRGGTPGYPVTTTAGYKAWEDFGITSNWALEIPCYQFSGVFPANQCYATIQGTSMATPHVSAVIALVSSYNKAARWNPKELIRIVKAGARQVVGNKTPSLSKGDLRKGDLSGIVCGTGYCHLGGDPISDREAYGAGIVDAYGALNAP